MGAVIINEKWTNGSTFFVAGDIISIFFGIIFGAMAMGFSAPFQKAVMDGKVNCALALEVIDRKPAIILNDQSCPSFNPGL